MQQVVMKFPASRMCRVVGSLNSQVRSVITAEAYKSEQPAKKGSYTDKQAMTGRPVSPHVTIYRFPIAAVTSIMNRVTGVALSVGVTGVAALAIAGVDSSAIATIVGNVPVAGNIAKFAVGFPLIYHYFGAVRHYMQDNRPEVMLTSEVVTRGSQILLGTSIASSVAVAFLVV